MVVNERLGGVPDPYGGDPALYERCARILEKAALDIVESLPKAQS